jgi:hypothetical protein
LEVHVVVSEVEPTPAEQQQRRLVRQLYRYRWVLVGVLLAGLAVLAVQGIGASPAYDPYGWLNWGWLTLHSHLDLDSAPSWKPFTYIFTLPYALFGHLAVKMWMVTETGVSFGGPFVAGRIAYKLVYDGTEQRWPARLGAVAAGVCLMTMSLYWKYWVTSQSDPMMTTVFLLFVDCLIRRRLRWALFFIWLVACGRPEAWPFLILYSLWLGWQQWQGGRRLELLVTAAALVSIPLLWYGVPVLCGDSWNVSSHIDKTSGHGIKSNAIRTVLSRFRDLMPWPVEIAAAIGLLVGLWRRDRTILLLVVIAILWVAVEAAFAIKGLSGAPRYMFEAAAVTCVVAAAGAASMMAVAWRIGSGLQNRRRLGYALQAAGVVIAVGLALATEPHIRGQWDLAHTQVNHERQRTTNVNALASTIRALGGVDNVKSCGTPSATVGWASVLGYMTHLNGNRIGWDTYYLVYGGQTTPAVLFTQWGATGWEVQTYNIPKADQARCSNMQAAYWKITPQHPGGYLTHGKPLPSKTVQRGP